LKVLIDGDIFRYRCAFAAERTKYLLYYEQGGEELYKRFDSSKEMKEYAQINGMSWYEAWSRKDLQPLENCLQITKSCLENTLEEVRSHFNVDKLDYSIWLSGKTNFREAVASTRPYKGNRDETPKPAYYKDVGDYLVGTWSAVYTEGIEADDAIGIAALEAKAAGEDYCIVSNDKDLKQIPGCHYNWVTKEFSTISPKDAKFQLFAQILSGDATDNVPGLDGIGPATAAKILEGAQSPEEMVDKVAYTYIDHSDPVTNDWKEYLMEQWALVYILRGSPSVSSTPVHNLWKDTKEGKYFLEKYNG
jgi:hypothetical protein